jgi:hypothetical protein
MISPSNITLMKKRTVLFQNYGIWYNGFWYTFENSSKHRSYLKIINILDKVLILNIIL